MFHDSNSEKIRNILIPIGIWLAAGMAGELLGVLWEFLKLQGVSGDAKEFLSLLEAAHEEGEILLLLFRAIVSSAFLAVLFRRDTLRIASEKDDLPAVSAGALLRSEKTGPVEVLLCVLTAVSFCLFFNLFLSGMGRMRVGRTQEAPAGIIGILTVIYSVIAAPLSEELMMRGLIYRRVRTYAVPILAMFVSALLFAVLHWNLKQSLFAFFLGLLLCEVFERTGKLWLPVLIHSVCNMTSLCVNELDLFVTTFAKKGMVMKLSGMLFAASFVALAFCEKKKRQEMNGEFRDREER